MIHNNITIAWDVDDVLNNLTFEWVKFYNSKNNSNIRYEKLRNNPPYEVLNISLELFLKSLDEFRHNKFCSLDTVDSVYKWFQSNGDKYKHIALTAVPILYSHLSAQWVIKHFGRWIRSFNFVPSYRREVDIPIYYKNKATFLKENNNTVLFIDDSEKNIKEAQQIGVECLLFPRPWNSNREMSIDKFISELNIKLEKLENMKSAVH